VYGPPQSCKRKTAVPDDPPRSIALTLEFRNEVRLMSHRHTCTTAVFVIGATADCQVSATRNVYSLVDETDSPIGVVGKAQLEALLPNGSHSRLGAGLRSDSSRVTSTFNDMEEHGRYRKLLEVRRRQRYCVSQRLLSIMRIGALLPDVPLCQFSDDQ
jgi:hypothetical protein